MFHFRVHIIFFLSLVWVITACSERNKEEKENVIQEEKLFQKTEIPKNSAFQQTSIQKEIFNPKFENKIAESYATTKVELIGEKVFGNFSELVSKDKKFEYQADLSLRKRNPNMQYSLNKNPWILRIIFDNDIFNNTDYYYTNGARIELVTPFADNSPVNSILPAAGKSSLNFSGFSLTQNIYTPINPDAVEIQYNDRPFSAFLAIGQFRESVNFQNKINLKSELSIGVVGPASMGCVVQSSIHDIEPVGWQNQVKNDLVLDYYILAEKGLISNQHIELNATARGNLGTLFDKAGAGFYFRTGRFLPVYRGILSSLSENKTKQPVQFWFFLRGSADLIFYDATLQGGMFNHQNTYVIDQKSMNRIVYGGSAGIAFYSGNMGIEMENFYLSPEFDGSKQFMYGRIKLAAGF